MNSKISRRKGLPKMGSNRSRRVANRKNYEPSFRWIVVCGLSVDTGFQGSMDIEEKNLIMPRSCGYRRTESDY